VLASEAHLHKVLMKEKAIATSDLLPPEVSAPPRSMPDKASINVAARLYNANPVKSALAQQLPLIRGALGVEKVDTRTNTKNVSQDAERETRKAAKSKEKPRRVVDTRDAEEESSDGEEDFFEGVGGSESESDSEASEDNLEHAALSDGDDFATLDVRVAGSSDEEDINQDDFADFDARVAGSSDENDEEQEEDDEHDGRIPPRIDSRPFRERTFLASEGSHSPAPEGDPEPEFDAESPPPEPKAKAKNDIPRPKDSTFLPSLTMGGYWSGSESDVDAENKADDIDVAPRKNRRGQRARQQIWEKKFGQKAKHVVNETGLKKPGRDDGWDAKRGAKDSRGAKDGKYKPAWAKAKEHRGGAGVSGENAMPLGKQRGGKLAKIASDKPLHPSWEAAKKAKEAKKIDITAFAGKKMTFD
jgi:hypothetical protein